MKKTICKIHSSSNGETEIYTGIKYYKHHGVYGYLCVDNDEVKFIYADHSINSEVTMDVLTEFTVTYEEEKKPLFETITIKENPSIDTWYCRQGGKQFMIKNAGSNAQVHEMGFAGYSADEVWIVADDSEFGGNGILKKDCI